MRRVWRRWWVRAAVYAAVLCPPALILLAAYTGRPHDGGPLPTIPGHSEKSRIEPRFSRVARELAGKGEVRCWSGTDWPKRTAEFVHFNHMRIVGGRAPAEVIQAYLSPNRKRVNFSADVCNWLAVFVYDHRSPQTDVARAFTIFAEMIQHLRGERNERVAECRGLHSIHDVSIALGANEADADALETLSWSLYEARDPERRLPDCHR